MESLGERNGQEVTMVKLEEYSTLEKDLGEPRDAVRRRSRSPCEGE